jgi:hypothetical protein
MRYLLKPYWILLTVCLPILMFLFMNYSELKPVWSTFSSEQSQLILTFAEIFGGLVLLNLGYAVYLMIRQRKMSLPAAAVNLIALVTLLYLYYANTIDMGFASLPGWMISGNTLWFGLMFIGPACLYNLIVLSIYTIALSANKKGWLYLLIFVSIPLTLFVAFWLGDYFRLSFRDHLNVNFMIIMIMISILVMLYFLITGLLLISRRSNSNYSSTIIWKIIISLILPLTGLLLSNGVFSRGSMSREFAVFGDFSSYWFYVLTVANAVLLCLPKIKNQYLHYVVFLLKSITFAFTLYFFILFFPMLPLSLFAVLIYGAGLLMQAPLALFMIHVQSMHSDFRRLKKDFSKTLLYLSSILAFMIIPSLIILSFVRERSAIMQGLEYVYNPDYSKNSPVSTQQMAQALDQLEFHNNGRQYIYRQSLPLISGMYQAIVLDNLTLSQEKFNTLQKIYTPKNYEERLNWGNDKDSVMISDIHTRSHYDAEKNAWISSVDLELTNFEKDRMQSEYSTVFELPDGCFISGYYLDVNGKKKKGMMCEKKSALWVYSRIRDYRRDPGILFYTTGNKVAFNVYPFNTDETRKTGFELIHKEPFCLRLDGREIPLGDTTQTLTAAASVQQGPVIYISSAEKSKLKKIARTPYYHFIIDVSASRKGQAENYMRSIQSLLARELIPDRQIRISLTNCNVRDVAWDAGFRDTLNNCKYEGGFFADRAIRKILVKEISHPCNSYPIIVVLTPKLADALISGDYNDLRCGYPENDYFYELTEKGDLFKCCLSRNPQEIITYCKTIECDSVYALSRPGFPVRYLPDNSQGNFVYYAAEQFPSYSTDAAKKNWNACVYHQASWMALLLHPEITETHWKELAESGMQSGIMNHFTSYIVVETEAQEQVLLKKQEAVLSGHNSLDAGESMGMPDGDLWITLALLVVMIFLPPMIKKRFRFQ